MTSSVDDPCNVRDELGRILDQWIEGEIKGDVTNTSPYGDQRRWMLYPSGHDVCGIDRHQSRWSTDMDKDRIEGSAKQVKGTVKEAVGKLVGDAKLETEGKADKAEGKLQNAVGGLKDTVRETVRKA